MTYSSQCGYSGISRGICNGSYCGISGNGYAGGGLEKRVSYNIAEPARIVKKDYEVRNSIGSAAENIVYNKSETKPVYSKADNYYSFSKEAKTETMYFSTEPFLKQGTVTPFVGEIEEIKNYIIEAFEKTTGKKLPSDIMIRLCSAEELKERHIQIAKTWSDGIQGFAINRKRKGWSEIYIKKDELARVLLTIGHEIGHVIANQLKDCRDEEAKAYAFAIEWMRTIQKYNIAGLGDKIIVENPAKNGVHNIAFEFVIDMLRKGMKAMDIFTNLIKGIISGTK